MGDYRASIAVGTNANASGADSTAIGYAAITSGATAIALGHETQASAINALAFGARAQANAEGAIAIGGNWNTGAGNAAFVGSTSANSIAIGNQSRVNGNSGNSVALGFNSSVTAANAVALGSGSVANVSNTVSVGASGSERKIVNLASGTLSSTSTEAVNGSQLYGLQSQISSGTIGLVQQSAAGQPIRVGAATNGTLIDFTGTAGTRTLTGLSGGTLSSSSTDAVNGAQLYTANQRVAAAFGTTLDVNGQLNAPSYTILGTSYNNVGGAFTAVNNSLTGLQTQISDGTIGLVQQSAAGQPITIGASTDGTVVNVAGTAGNRTVTGVAAGALSSTSTDAVNGSQLYATNQQVATNTADIAALNSTVTGLSAGNSVYIKNNNSGTAASATGANANAIGSGANAAGTDSIAFGTNAQATGSNAIAQGNGAAASGVNAVAIGAGATAAGSVAVGAGAFASNGGSAFGNGAAASGGVADVSSATAIGNSASATTANSVAIGQGASVAAVNGSAFGAGASVQAGAANSVAIGQGSVATTSNTMSIGSAGNERRITNVAAGVAPTDAVNMSQFNSVVAGMNYQPQIDSLQSKIDNTNRRVDKATAGVAMAMAMGGGSLQDKQRFALGMSYGTFAGQNALAMTSALRLSNSVVASGALGYGVNENQVGGRVAIQVGW